MDTSSAVHPSSNIPATPSASPAGQPRASRKTSRYPRIILSDRYCSARSFPRPARSAARDGSPVIRAMACRHLPGLPGIKEEGRIPRDLGKARDIAAQHRLAQGHGLDHRDPEALVQRREDQKQGPLPDDIQVFLGEKPQEMDMLPDPHPFSGLFEEALLILQGAGEDQVRGPVRMAVPEHAVGRQQHPVVLVGPEIGGIEHIGAQMNPQPGENGLPGLRRDVRAQAGLDAVVDDMGLFRVRVQVADDRIPNIFGDADDPAGLGPHVRHEEVPGLDLLLREELGIILVLHVVDHRYGRDPRLDMGGRRKRTEQQVHAAGREGAPPGRRPPGAPSASRWPPVSGAPCPFARENGPRMRTATAICPGSGDASCSAPPDRPARRGSTRPSGAETGDPGPRAETPAGVPGSGS